MKTYMGRRDGRGDAIVEVLDGNGGRIPLPLRLDLVNHSPTGFEWGFGGSGPAQLALALLADALQGHAPPTLKADDVAERLHHDFKHSIIARLAQSEAWSITESRVREIAQLLEARRGA